MGTALIGPQVFRALLTLMLQAPRAIEPAIGLILISRHLERIIGLRCSADRHAAQKGGAECAECDLVHRRSPHPLVRVRVRLRS